MTFRDGYNIQHVDTGQRYRVTYTNHKDKEQTFGFCDYLSDAYRMYGSILKDPCMHDPKIIERQKKENPNNE